MLNILGVAINSVLIIITIIVIGWGLAKTKIFSANFANDISNLVVNIALPLSILLSAQKYISKQNFGLLVQGTILIMIAIIICFLFSIGFSYFFKISKQRRSLFINGFVNSNTLFVGLPLNLALFGAKSLSYFLCYFVANTIATWGIGIKLINNDGHQALKSTNSLIWQKLIHLFTPPMWGFLVGLLFLFLQVRVTGFLNTALGYLASLVTPLSLIFLGFQLGNTELSDLKISWLDICAQMGRFIISPLIMFFVIVIAETFNWVYLQPLFVKTLVVQAATPMLTLLPMMAEKAKLDVIFATRILTESILIFPLAIIGIILII